ncbi:MAG: Polysaccharide deacetylase [Parcubacteria group bacterium GW2011_GWA2_51_10]|nr:MAG: Polysaccharide deacetylase [Parcubacteria group bacterium GW2011_GWA2_51_10]
MRRMHSARNRSWSSWIKWLILAFCQAVGLHHILRFLHGKELTIVLYHGVAPNKDFGIYNYRHKFIDPDVFEEQIKYFRRRYTIVPLDEGIRMMYERRLPKNALAITFDDGYRNWYEYAFPILKKYSVHATMFIATDFVFKKNPLWVDRLEYAIGLENDDIESKINRDAEIRAQLKKVGSIERERHLAAIERSSSAEFRNFEMERAVYTPLTNTDIEAMKNSGITFGAHTKSHPILSTLSAQETEVEVRDSVIALKEVTHNISETFA